MTFNFQDPTVYPVEQSASGKNAMHINGCHIVGQSQPYAACLKRIRDYVNGDQLESMPDCKRAIGGPACRAWSMMQEEAKAGHALYYIDRPKLQEHIGITVSERPQAAVSPVRDQSRQTVAVSAPRFPEPLTASYADVINASLAEIVTPAPVAKTVKPERPPMNPGETPLEYSRRLKAFFEQEMNQ